MTDKVEFLTQAIVRVADAVARGVDSERTATKGSIILSHQDSVRIAASVLVQAFRDVLPEAARREAGETKRFECPECGAKAGDMCSFSFPQDGTHRPKDCIEEQLKPDAPPAADLVARKKADVSDLPYASWENVAAAVEQALNNAEGRASPYYLEHHFRLAQLAVLHHVDLPDYTQLRAEIETLHGQVKELENDVYVPGQFECPKCKLVAVHTVLHVQSGGMSAAPSMHCANGCGPMWRVTWKQRAKDAIGSFEKLFDDKKALEGVLEQYRAGIVTHVQMNGLVFGGTNHRQMKIAFEADQALAAGGGNG